MKSGSFNVAKIEGTKMLFGYLYHGIRVWHRYHTPGSIVFMTRYGPIDSGNLSVNDPDHICNDMIPWCTESLGPVPEVPQVGQRWYFDKDKGWQSRLF
jgi:hypothetical protein